MGSLPSDDFSSSLSACVKPQEISTMKTARIEAKIRTCAQAYKLQVEMQQKRSIHEHPKNSTSWRLPTVSLEHESSKIKQQNNKVVFMRKHARWLTSSKEIADELREDGRWKHHRRHVHVTRKSVAASGCSASLVKATLSCRETHGDLGWCDRSGELHIAGLVPDERR